MGDFYNYKRLHQNLDYKTPNDVYSGGCRAVEKKEETTNILEGQEIFKIYLLSYSLKLLDVYLNKYNKMLQKFSDKYMGLSKSR
ncbi:MAG: hypothetical protein LBB21_06705 [Holosporaceae bacterium]|jgi:hypothetical protein|nr:hypothetical protein [Holosporaceae bacterium]